MCSGFKTRLLTPLLEEAMKYEFEEKPNYDKLEFLMKKILIENDVKPSENFIFDPNQPTEVGPLCTEC